jgi:hypothetical protein
MGPDIDARVTKQFGNFPKTLQSLFHKYGNLMDTHSILLGHEVRWQWRLGRQSIAEK